MILKFTFAVEIGAYFSLYMYNIFIYIWTDNIPTIVTDDNVARVRDAVLIPLADDVVLRLKCMFVARYHVVCVVINFFVLKY